MNKYSHLYSKHVLYKDIMCRVAKVPINDFEWANYFEILPVHSVHNIGKGCGMSVKLTPQEFDEQVTIDIPQPFNYEK